MVKKKNLQKGKGTRVVGTGSNFPLGDQIRCYFEANKGAKT